MAARLTGMTGEPGTLRDALIARGRADPSRLAYDDGARQISYGQLAETADEQAARLASMGVRQGDRVALAMSSGIPFAQAFWALQLLGATPAAFNPTAPAETVERRASLVRPRLLLTDDWLATAPPANGTPADPQVTPDDIAFLQPTSGTSGDPRAAQIRHRNVLAYLRASGEDGHVSRDDVLVSWVPPWHDFGLVRFVIGSVFPGAPCHIVQPAIRTIPDWLATITRTRGTMTGAPDFCYRLATRMVDPASVDLSSLRLASNGGEPVRSSTIELFERRFGVSGVVLPAYGLAEATLGVTTVLPGEALVADAHGNVSNGRPLSGLEVRVDGDASAPGEILVRGNVVFAGYFDAVDETERCLRDGWLHTGDVGYLDSEGRLFVLGRERSMIKRAGAVVAPRELEEAALQVEGVRVAAAVGIPARSGVTETIAVVVEADRRHESAAETLSGAVSREIAAQLGFAPGQVTVVPPRTLPHTENGKVRHDRVRALLLDGSIDSTAAG